MITLEKTKEVLMGMGCCGNFEDTDSDGNIGRCAQGKVGVLFTGAAKFNINETFEELGGSWIPTYNNENEKGRRSHIFSGKNWPIYGIEDKQWSRHMKATMVAVKHYLSKNPDTEIEPAALEYIDSLYDIYVNGVSPRVSAEEKVTV